MALYSPNTRIVGESITAAKYLADHQVHADSQTPQLTEDYSTTAGQMQATRDPYPASVVSLATSLAEELEGLRYVLKKLTGWSQWYAHTERPELPTFNYTFNGDMEVWGAGTAVAPTGWALSGAGATVAKNTTAGQFKIGTASVAITRSGATALLAQDIAAIAGFGPAAWWQGKKVTFGCWVRATVASRAQIAIGDGVGETLSAFHSGGSAFEFLTVTRTLDAAATSVAARCYVLGGDTTAQFDGAILVVGETVSDFIPSGWRGRKSVVAFSYNNGAFVMGGTTAFLTGTNLTGTENGMSAPFTCVIRRLATNTGASPGAGQTYTFTVRKANADTALVATQSAVDSGSDLTNEVAVASGDRLDVKVVGSAGAANILHTTAAFEIEEVP